MQKVIDVKRTVRRRLQIIQTRAICKGVDIQILKNYNYVCNFTIEIDEKCKNKTVVLLGIVIPFICVFISFFCLNSILSTRCLLPSNFLVWEATRPLADCTYCKNITEPIILRNITREKFTKYTFSSKPIIVKHAINHWKAAQNEFGYDMFKRLYEHTVGSYESLDEGCQFLNFKTDLFSLKEVFNMPVSRAKNEPGEKPWYVGWGNCHPDILLKVRQYYDIPEFLPSDAEFPATENIFFGYEMGAVMHLDYIQRLMWQGQVKGNKSWLIAPVPECDHVCHEFHFYVEPGDIVFLDTRIWYHSTSIPKGQFSLTVQSEYG